MLRKAKGTQSSKILLCVLCFSFGVKMSLYSGNVSRDFFLLLLLLWSAGLMLPAPHVHEAIC